LAPKSWCLTGIQPAPDRTRNIQPTNRRQAIKTTFTAAATAPGKQRVHYQVVNSLFAGHKKMACSGTGANLGFKDIESSFLELINTK
jgi:hypothetical protein